MFQFVRLLLPLGEIWTPILDELVKFIGDLESESIKDVAYYRVVNEFVQSLLDENIYKGIQITGHSLGGGLSMIAGAQLGVPAIALSGPNTMISRRVFGNITEDDLNTFTFNIIPERDIVPMLDDPARLNQKIRCTTGLNDPLGCHKSSRSLCEILYTCGSSGRPIPSKCFCDLDYDTPEPISDSIEFLDKNTFCEDYRNQFL